MSKTRETLIIIILVFSIYIPLVYGAEGDYMRVWSVNPLNNNPRGLGTDGINIYAGDNTDDAVYKYDMNGNYIEFWNLNGLNDYPHRLTSDGINIWVLDYGDKAIYKYDMDGNYIEFWNPNALNDLAYGLATDGINIYILDYPDKAIYKYDMDGNYDTFWNLDVLNDNPYTITTEGTSMWVTDATDYAVYKYDMNGLYIGVWDLNINNDLPFGMATNGTTIMVLDNTDDAVYVYEGGISYPTPDAPTELFGAGFNSSTPYVKLYWNHNNLTLVDVFEVQNSTDKVSWDRLGYNSTTEYIDYQVVNGTDRYYRVRACKYQPDRWHNSSWIDDFETVYFLKGENGLPCDVTYLYGDWVEYNVSSYEIIEGSYWKGDLSSFHIIDDDCFFVNETGGKPALDLRINFTDVDLDIKSLAVRTFSFYEGSPSHNLTVDAYNFTSKGWKKIHEHEEGEYDEGSTWLNSSLSLKSEDFIDEGKVWMRVDYPDGGHIKHWICIDYFKLRGFVPLYGDNYLWLIILLFLGLIGYVVMKVRR